MSGPAEVGRDNSSRQHGPARRSLPRAVAMFLPSCLPHWEISMRVALVTEFYYPHLGGVTEHVHNLARTLIQSGHHAIVITSHMAELGRGHQLGDMDEDPSYVYRIGTSRVIYSYGSFARVTTGLGLRRRIRDILRREQIDLVHV